MSGEAIRAFLLGFPALFSIVNPLSGAFIFFEVTEARGLGRRERLAGTVALYSLLVMVVALWAGSFILAFFGITLAALRVAGGLVVALSAWGLLNAPEQREERKQAQAAPAAAPAEAGDDIAFFPLTIPFTTGPGTIAVAVTLGAARPAFTHGLPWFLLGMTGAAAAVAASIWIAYRVSERIARLLGPTGRRTATRLFAFLLLCIGVQILITGVEDVLRPLLAGR